MPLNFSDMMSDVELGATQFTRLRLTETLDKDGESSKAYVPTELTGIVLPAKLADAVLLPEGMRLSDVNAFFTASDVRCGDGETTLSDRLVHAGSTFIALHVQDFSQYGMYKVLAQRIPAGTPPAPGGGGG